MSGVQGQETVIQESGLTVKVVAFHGSPRIGGNTDILLREAVRSAADAGHETQVFRLSTMDIRPCQNCGGCEETGVCVLKDDMDEVYDAIRGADRIILTSPIFFFALSAQTKKMIDRCQAFWCERYLLKRTIPGGQYGRKGLLIMVGGMKRDDGIHCGEVTAKAFFRTISVPRHETVSFLGIDAKGAILEHPTALKDVREIGKKLVSPADVVG
jgi:multimeric flavodoxin WrbA